MRAAELVLVLPVLYVVLAARAALPSTIPPSMVFTLMTGVLALLGWPMVARGVRAIVAREALQEFAVAARAMGASPARIVWRHLAPAALGFVRIQGAAAPAGGHPRRNDAVVRRPRLRAGRPELGHAAARCQRSRGAERRAVAPGRRRSGRHGRLRDQPGQPLNRSTPRSALIGRAEPFANRYNERVPLDLAGILPPVATPFVDDEVDLAAMRANCERWMRTGLRGVLLLGTNGEAALIRDDEAVRLVAAAREAVPRDRVLLVGTGRQATRDVVALSKAVAREGADAVLVLTPSVYRNQLTPATLVAHYRAIADGSPVPVLLYNMPQATGVTLTPAMVQELASHPNIGGIKESSGDVAVVGDLVGRASAGFPVVVGAAASLYASLMVGATGAIVAIANVVPELCVRLFELARAGRHEEALALQRALTPLAAAVTTGFGVPGLKAAMALAGYRPGQPRRPLLPLDERRSPHNPRPLRDAVHPGGSPDRQLIAMSTPPLPDVERLLLGPGPSPVSPRIMRAMAAPVLSHLDPDMLKIMDDLRARLGRVFMAPADGYSLAVSGTGSAGMEMAVANLVREGHARPRHRQRLLRRTPRPDLRALRRAGRRASTCRGAGPSIPSSSPRPQADAGRHRRDGPRRDVHRVLNPVEDPWPRSRASTAA